MKLRFVKMQGAGNDYVYVDAIAQPAALERAPAWAARLADRHRGIGADGLILLAPSARAELRMLMWNADGSRGAMCGNGLRCVARLGCDEGHAAGPIVTVETDVGLRRVELLRDAASRYSAARASMPGLAVEITPAELAVDGERWSYHRGDAGNPHAVVFVDGDPADCDVARLGQAFQRADAFPDGVNVEFVRAVPPDSLLQRTFERGSGETLACGSGACIAALAAIETGHLPGPRVDVHLRGGTLRIRRVAADEVDMEGPIERVFDGVIEID